MQKIKNQKLKKLKQYFEKRKDVVMAFVFGSRTKGLSHSGSDWDIGVYFKPLHWVEWENEIEYPAEDKVWGDCVDILQTDNVDLIVLNRAPVSIADTAIRGIPLVIKDRKLFTKFMLIATMEAEDYRQFVDDYYEIYQRSTSLNPMDMETLKKTIIFVEQQMTLYSRYIMNGIVDISKIVLGSKKKLVPETYRKAVELGISTLNLPKESRELVKWVKLRNILAYEYIDVRWRNIEDFIQNSQNFVISFIESTKKVLKR